MRKLTSEQVRKAVEAYKKAFGSADLCGEYERRSAGLIAAAEFLQYAPRERVKVVPVGGVSAKYYWVECDGNRVISLPQQDAEIYARGLRAQLARG